MNKHTKHIVVITGSARPHNFTMKAALILVEELKKNSSITFEVIDGAALKLPLPGTAFVESSHEMLQEKARHATGIILASPEYHGGISSVMKLIIDHLGFPSALAGKPIALLGVAAGSIGAIKSLEAVLKPGSVDFRVLLGYFRFFLRGLIYEVDMTPAKRIENNPK